MNPKHFLILIPIIAVYTSGYYFPVRNYEDKKINFQPPGYVFGIVWPILLTLIGIAWYMRPELSFYYGILTFLLSIWTILYTYSKKIAFVDIIVTIIFTLYLISIKTKSKKKNKSIDKSAALLIPLVLWLTFASYLGYQSI